MAKKRKKQKTEAPAVEKKQPIIIALQVVAALLVGLAIFQWIELLEVQRGGTAFCAIDETINCEAVWNSPFAKDIHKITGVPIAGWGLVYGIAALVLAFLYGRKPQLATLMGTRLVGIAGAFTSVVLLVVSWQLGHVCLMCVATYTLVVVYTGLAFKLKGTEKTRPPLSKIATAPVVTVVAAYLVLLMPGRATPIEPKSHIPKVMPAEKNVERVTEPKPVLGQVAGYLATLPPDAKQAISNTVAQMKSSATVSGFTPRFVAGNEKASIRFQDWSDILCGHCARLDKVMHQLEKTAPGSFSLESRWFPLDSACNPTVPPDLKDPSGVRCYAPRVLICMEGQPGYHAARSAMFEVQQVLTKAQVLKIALGQGGMDPAALDTCVGSEATTKKLREDIAYAKKFDLHGTPLVLVNGRKASSVPPFLFAIILANGDVDHPAFAMLPPPEANPHLH